MGKAMVDSMCTVLSSAKWNHEGYCHRHESRCPFKPELEASESGSDVWLEVAGSTCVAWSAMKSSTSVLRRFDIAMPDMDVLDSRGTAIAGDPRMCSII